MSYYLPDKACRSKHQSFICLLNFYMAFDQLFTDIAMLPLGDVGELYVDFLFIQSDLNELVKEAEEKLHLLQTTPRKLKKRQAGVITSSEGNIKIDSFGGE